MLERDNGLFTADTHVHTIDYSDGIYRVGEEIKRAYESGLNLVAITDHDRVGGGLEAAEITEQLYPSTPEHPFRVLPAVEHTTRRGHLIGLFPEYKKVSPKDIPPLKYSFPDTVDYIRQQEGLIIVPHVGFLLPPGSIPHDDVRKLYLGGQEVDAIETRHPSYRSWHRKRADVLAKEVATAKIGVSDDHLGQTGRKFITLYPNITGDPLEDFITAVKNKQTTVEHSDLPKLPIPLGLRVKRQWTSLTRDFDRKVMQTGRIIFVATRKILT